MTARRFPNLLKFATVAIEDRNFYEHGGVDYTSIVRAAWADLKAGSPVQGGSTITQQLVRNLYIAHPQEDIERKIEEAKLATEYEDKYTKDQILTKYLNTASYGTTNGRTAVGVQAAAETYFNRGVSHLDLPQAAMIAGLPQAPSQYNPFVNPKAALERRNEVLLAMQQQGYISQADYDQASQADLGLDPGHKYDTIHEPYFFDYVQQQLIDKYGVNTVRNGGLKVYTTINPQLQVDAQRAVDACAVCYTGGGPAAALASVDVTNGHILAMASSQPYSPTSQFNFAADAHRQPGSSFKPYVLAAALKEGMNPDSTYYSGASPMTLSLPDGTSWTVNNAEKAGAGTLSVRQATVESVNVVFAQLDLDVGPENVRKAAYAAGITTHLDAFPAEGIGGLRIGVTPLEQADAYATFANGGIHNSATAIGKIVFPERRHRHAGREQQLEGVLRRGRLRAHRRAQGSDHLGDRGRLHGHRLPGGGQDRNNRGRVRRLVRRLHAEDLDRGLGGAPRVPRHHRLRRPHRRPDLAELHVGGEGQLLRRLPAAAEPHAVLELLERLPHGLLAGLAGIVEQLELPRPPPRRRRAPGARPRGAGTATRRSSTRPAQGKGRRRRHRATAAAGPAEILRLE